jgi:hypothetical protein
MQLCKNGSLRENYGIFRLIDRVKVGTAFVTSKEQAVTAFLTKNDLPLYDEERDKYYARPLACREARAHFVQEAKKLQAKLKARGIRRVIRENDILPAPPAPEPDVHELAFAVINRPPRQDLAFAVVNRPPRQLELDLSGEEEVDF